MDYIIDDGENLNNTETSIIDKLNRSQYKK